MEMLAVLIVVAVLGSLAWPVYREHVLQTRRSSAAVALVELAARLELHYADHGTYEDAALGTRPGTIFPSVAADGHYRLKITSQDDLYYRISATPATRGSRQRDTCGTLMLDSLGNRTHSGVSSTERCWR